jgi:hypothetical protein
MWIGIVIAGDGEIDASIRFEGMEREDAAKKMEAFFLKYYGADGDDWHLVWADTLEEASNELDEAINEEQQAAQREIERRNDDHE